MTSSALRKRRTTLRVVASGGELIDPLTPGSNEYIDHGDIRITKEFVQTKGHEKKQELEMDDADDLDDFLTLVDKEIRVLCFVLY